MMIFKCLHLEYQCNLWSGSPAWATAPSRLCCRNSAQGCCKREI